MSEREILIKEFLQQNNLGDASRYRLSSDASFRHYERITTKDKKTMMLMDAPPGKEDVRPFVNIDKYLKQRGFSAPEIFAADEANGFLLLEDLGDESYTKVLDGSSKFSSKYEEYEIYSAAIDVLIQLDRSTLPEKTPGYNDELLVRESNLLVDWYIPNVMPEFATPEVKQEYIAIWDSLLHLKKVTDDVIVLRDYHADNLMWLPERNGVERVGLLDFQDAVIGSPVYDMVSLLEDARRDVSSATVAACISRYLEARTSINRNDFMAAYAILAAQRNCKIIGIFSRLAIRDNKPRYINYMPRVWGHLQYDLKHPVLAELKKWFDKYIPENKRSPSAFDLSKKEYAVG